MNRYGAQRARQLRPRCIRTVRSRTQSQINPWLWNQFNTGLKHHLNFIFNCIKNTKTHIEFFGKWIVGITKKTENKDEINVIQLHQESSLQNTTGRKHKNFKNNACHLHTASTIYKKKVDCTSRNEIKKTWGSYNMHLAFLTLLIREIQMF